jgi:hypothetical protein
MRSLGHFSKYGKRYFYLLGKSGDSYKPSDFPLVNPKNNGLILSIYSCCLELPRVSKCCGLATVLDLCAMNTPIYNMHIIYTPCDPLS